MFRTKILLTAAALALALTALSLPAFSQGGFSGLIPKSQTNAPTDTGVGEDLRPTHPSIHMTPDKSLIVRLNQDAGSLIVGNPAHVSVLMDSPNLLVLVPKEPGATFFTVLDENGKVIMQRHVVVASPTDKYIRVRRSCANAEDACTQMSVYYCPGICHEIHVNPESEGAGDENGAAAGDADEQQVVIPDR